MKNNKEKTHICTCGKPYSTRNSLLAHRSKKKCELPKKVRAVRKDKKGEGH